MQLRYRSLGTVLFIILAGIVGNAHAALWKIDQVLTGVGVTGFGASSFHRASDSTPMSGSILGTITAGAGMFGTWDDQTGDFDGTFNLTGIGGPTFTAVGNLLFTGTDLDEGSFTVDFSGTNLFQGTNSGEIFFPPGHVCCEAIVGPNSLVNDATGKIMTLWGANGNDGDTFAGGNDTDLGIDLRIHLVQVQVPEPVTLILAGLGLTGLVLLRRRQSRTLTTSNHSTA